MPTGVMPQRRQKMGRPTLFTPQHVARYLEAARLPIPKKDAAALAGWSVAQAIEYIKLGQAQLSRMRAGEKLTASGRRVDRVVSHLSPARRETARRRDDHSVPGHYAAGRGRHVRVLRALPGGGAVSDLCQRCALKAEERGGLCGACRNYAWRTGKPRPGQVIERHAERLSKRGLDERRR